MAKTTEEIRAPYEEHLADLKAHGWKHQIRLGNYGGEVLYVRGDEHLIVKWGFFPSGARATKACYIRPRIDSDPQSAFLSVGSTRFVRDLPKSGLTAAVKALVTSEPWRAP
jgi:hypothetical protein